MAKETAARRDRREPGNASRGRRGEFEDLFEDTYADNAGGETSGAGSNPVEVAMRVAEEVDLFGERELHERSAMESVPYRGVTFLINVRYRPAEMDPWQVGNALLRIARALGLTPFPETLRVVTFPVKEGYLAASASLILMESHINASTWPERGLLRLEVSSCRKIERELMERVLSTLFGEGHYELEARAWVED
ncbi:S-adenosylmethionine decarboxylase [Thermosulfurimonas sp. F29]|uniref:S-adenosylmethionine decarboxylase n=1 Tax=Thermosulfurimonas sp. F29 TaxID=2867247 RepID=UPI001C82FF97|nr:S-adenosylmethionine decarboxylase [Thermosulfurimonas sp. F29]MBX6424190.1 S-adenosylmethionine decarboxylase [Thermosulfurimonas sp. F29]